MELNHLTMPIAGAFAAIAMSIIGFAWLNGIARNPQASKEMFVPGIIALALCEFIALLAFVVTLIK